MMGLQRMLQWPGMGSWLRQQPDQGKPVEIDGIVFPNRVGLAAGFDKNALYLSTLSQLGFGHLEIGTVTPLPQYGNARPRLFRLPHDHALMNRLGFNNDGAVRIAERLRKRPRTVIVGGNLGKNKTTPNAEAATDYAFGVEALYEHVDYFTINVSSPNTPGLRDLQQVDQLDRILDAVVPRNQPRAKPVFLKIAPDLHDGDIKEMVRWAAMRKLSGIIATNTTVARSGLKSKPREITKLGAGGLSGAPLRRRALEVTQLVRRLMPSSMALIASGGVMRPEDAVARRQSGADLVQLWTGFVYEGPALIHAINRAL